MSHADDTSDLVPARGNLPAPRRSPLAERVASDLAAGRPRVGVGTLPPPLADRILEALDPLRDRMEVIDVSGWGNTALEHCHGRVDVFVCFDDVELALLHAPHLPPLPFVFLDSGGESWVRGHAEDAACDTPGFLLPCPFADTRHLIHLPWLVELALQLGRDQGPEARPRRMLWVEDEDLIRDVLEEYLPHVLGSLQLHTATSAGEAFEMLDGRIDEFDLVVTDVCMPGAGDGLALLERLRPQAARTTPLALEWHSLAGGKELLQRLSTETRPHVYAVVNLKAALGRRAFERLFRIKDAMCAIRQRSP